MWFNLTMQCIYIYIYIHTYIHVWWTQYIVAFATLVYAPWLPGNPLKIPLQESPERAVVHRHPCGLGVFAIAASGQRSRCRHRSRKFVANSSNSANSIFWCFNKFNYDLFKIILYILFKVISSNKFVVPRKCYLQMPWSKL